MGARKRLAIRIAAITAAAVIGGAAGGAFSSTQAGIGTSPGTRKQAGFGTSPGTRYQAGVSTSPGRHVALSGRKAGGGHQEYILAIPGVRGTGGDGR